PRDGITNATTATGITVTQTVAARACGRCRSRRRRVGDRYSDDVVATTPALCPTSRAYMRMCGACETNVSACPDTRDRSRPSAMRLAAPRPNVELREGADGATSGVLAFPYDAQIVNAVRGIPHRRFDWDTREWWAPADDWSGIHVAEVLDRFPELVPADDVRAW